MKGLDLLMDLGKVSKTEHKVNNEHVPSTIQPDTLFTFTTEFKWLISMLKNKMISPRYCSEDIEYLKIEGIKKIAFPSLFQCFKSFGLIVRTVFQRFEKTFGIGVVIAYTQSAV